MGSDGWGWKVVSSAAIDDVDEQAIMSPHNYDSSAPGKSIRILQLLRIVAKVLAQLSRYGASICYDLDPSTRVIAVLGPSTSDDCDWDISDFCLPHRILGDVRQTDHWLASSQRNLTKFMESTGQDILHENVTYSKQRKVVFGREDHDGCKNHPASDTNPQTRFKNHVSIPQAQRAKFRMRMESMPSY